MGLFACCVWVYLGLACGRVVSAAVGSCLVGAVARSIGLLFPDVSGFVESVCKGGLLGFQL